MEMRINEEDLLKLMEELRHLRTQRDDLQTNNTQLEEERRVLKKIIQRTNIYDMHSFHAGNEEEKALYSRWISITCGRE